MEYLSTTSLANELDISSNELFGKLKSLGWIERNSYKWCLTELRRKKGSEIRRNLKYGDFIVLSENNRLESSTSPRKDLESS